MKKFIVFLLALFLIGCSAKEDEIISFIDQFNENANEYSLVSWIDKNNLPNIREEKNGHWRELYEGKYYRIESKHTEKGETKGYYLSISGDFTTPGYEAAKTLAKTIGLDINTFDSKYTEAESGEVNLDGITYTENGYEINITKTNIGIIVNFDKIE